jgi:hypothetical protein
LQQVIFLRITKLSDTKEVPEGPIVNYGARLPALKPVSIDAVTRGLIDELLLAPKMIGSLGWWSIQAASGRDIIYARTPVDNPLRKLLVFQMTRRYATPLKYEFALHLGTERIFAIDVGREHRPYGDPHENHWLRPLDCSQGDFASYITDPGNHESSFWQALGRLHITYSGPYPFKDRPIQMRLAERGLADELRSFGRRGS